jgi:hypothetical protein
MPIESCMHQQQQQQQQQVLVTALCLAELDVVHSTVNLVWLLVVQPCSACTLQSAVSLTATEWLLVFLLLYRNSRGNVLVCCHQLQLLKTCCNVQVIELLYTAVSPQTLDMSAMACTPPVICFGLVPAASHHLRRHVHLKYIHMTSKNPAERLLRLPKAAEQPVTTLDFRSAPCLAGQIWISKVQFWVSLIAPYPSLIELIQPWTSTIIRWINYPRRIQKGCLGTCCRWRQHSRRNGHRGVLFPPQAAITFSTGSYGLY